LIIVFLVLLLLDFGLLDVIFGELLGALDRFFILAFGNLNLDF
jgi:hypothetical protein